jgi:hypothetical protein
MRQEVREQAQDCAENYDPLNGNNDFILGFESQNISAMGLLPFEFPRERGLCQTIPSSCSAVLKS